MEALWFDGWLFAQVNCACCRCVAYFFGAWCTRDADAGIRCSSGNHELQPVDPTREAAVAALLRFRVLCLPEVVEEEAAAARGGGGGGGARAPKSHVEAEISTCGVMQVCVARWLVRCLL
jgi:hypothetical protein